MEWPPNYHLKERSNTVNPLSVNPTKWSNTLRQFVSKLPTNCLSVFDHLATLALKGLMIIPKHIIVLKVSKNGLTL